MARGKDNAYQHNAKEKYRDLGFDDILGKLERCSLPDIFKKSVRENGGQGFQRVAE
jgi:hypothetical protein